MANKRENKSMAWPSSILGCLPSSKDALPPKMRNSRPPHESDDDDHAFLDTAIDDEQLLDKLSKQIDTFLHQAESRRHWSENLGTIATGIYISSKGIHSMSRVSSTAFDKLKSTKFEDLMSTAGDILAVMGKVHWAASGLLVVAAVINNIERTKRVDKECIELLALVNTVARSLRRLTKLPQLPEEMETTVNRAKAIISKSAACCFSIIQSQGLCRFIFSSSNQTETSACKKDLESMQQSLIYQLVVAEYAERHETVGSAFRRKMKQQGDYISKSEGQEGVLAEEIGSPRRKLCNIGECLQKLRHNHRGETHGDISSEMDDGENPVMEIEKLLQLKNKEKAIAVFLFGQKQTGRESIAEDKYLQGKLAQWGKLVTIKKFENKRAKDGPVADDEVLFDLREDIIKQLEPENYKQQAQDNKLQKAFEKDRDWQQKLSKMLEKAKKVYIYMPRVPSAQIVKRILPMKIGKDIRIRVLLISHDKNDLSALENYGFKTYLYVMKPLRSEEALHVFQDSVELGMNRELVVRKIIKICKGYKKRMETVLEYLLKYYFANNEFFNRLSEWIKSEEPNFVELIGYLKCEEKFLHLSEVAKDALLDVSSFFNGWNWHETACIIEDDVLENLKNLQLVKRDSDKVYVPSPVVTYCLSWAKGRRITNATELHDVMLAEKNKPGKLSLIKGIWMSENKIPFHIKSLEVDKMESLRVLALGDWTIVTGECSKHLRNLRYFQAGKIEKLPFKIDKVNDIRFLETTHHQYFGAGIQEVPPTLRMLKVKGMERLKNLKLVHYLGWTNLPDGCELTDLCLGGVDIKYLPDTLCDLHSLQSIFLNQCKDLKQLPKDFGKLQSLKTLDLSYCEVLNELPQDFGWLICLEKVSFSYCRKLKDLPESIGVLRSVKEMDFSYCKSLEKLPKNIVKLATLQVLRLRGCSHLFELPEGFEGLLLKELHLESCKRLRALHDKVGAAESLLQSKVSLSWCKNVVELSKGFVSVIKAQVVELILMDCVSLQILPEDFSTELCCLKVLNLRGCRSLLRLPNRFSKMKNLQSLNVDSCEKLEESSIKLSHLPLLREVNLANCHGLAGDCLGSLIGIESLACLDIHGSPMLIDRWNLLNKDRRICHLVVTTARPGLGSLPFSKSLKEDPHIRKELKRGIYEFFNGKWIFLDLNGQQFHPSSLQEGSTLAVLFSNDYREQDLQAVGRILDDLQVTCETLQIIHVGTCVTELEKKLPGNHVVYSCDNYGALVFFERALFTVEGFDQSVSYAMIISDVVCRDKHKTFASWTGVTYQSVRKMTTEMDFQKIDYLHLKDLIETENPQEPSNIKLLRELLQTKDTKFLISKKGQVGIKQLEGKFVFLLVSWLHNMETQYKAFNNVYQKIQKLFRERKFGITFEVVWIPIVIEGRGTRAVHAEWIEKIEWLSIVDPWSINPMVMRYFRRHTSFDKLPLLVAVSSDGIFYSDNFALNTIKDEAEVNIIELMKKKTRMISEQLQSKVKEVLRKLTEERKLRKEIENVEREKLERKILEWMERKVEDEASMMLREQSNFEQEMEKKTIEKLVSKVKGEVVMKSIEEEKEGKERKEGKSQMRENMMGKIKDLQNEVLIEDLENELLKETLSRVKKKNKINEESMVNEEITKETIIREDWETVVIVEVEKRFRKEVENKVEEEVIIMKIKEWWEIEVKEK